MKIELVCGICGVVLEELNHSESLALAEKIMADMDKKEHKIHQMKVPFCKQCANKYLYSNGTMKLEGE